MKTSNIICIYPSDQTTDFLSPIVKVLELYGASIFRLQPNDCPYNDIKRRIYESESGTLVFFLGHGADNRLYGAMVNGSKDIFVNSTENGIFNDKNIVLLACKSNDFIQSYLTKKRTQYPPLNAIGFGILPTDWNDVIAERDGDAMAFNGIIEQDIDYFRTTLVQIFSSTIKYILDKGFSVKKFYTHIKLRLNKEIATLLTERQKMHYSEIAALFHRVKEEVYFYSQDEN